MKIGCIPVCYFRELLHDRSMSLAQWSERAAALGLDGIELYKPYLQEEDRASLLDAAETIRRSGLEISMYTSYADFGDLDDERTAAQIESIHRDCDAAVLVGTDIVRVTAGHWRPGASREDTLRNVAAGLKACLDYAEARGVRLALEDHPAIGCDIGDFLRILELVDDARLKVNLDTSNPMEAGQSAAVLVRHVGDRVVHVHASDRSEDLEHQVVGEGVVDFAAIFKTLKAVGYDGYLSLEAGGTRGDQGIADGIAYVRRVWEAA
ncbi:MAG: sugar phosphate isomerase/epimerase family protein [Armatimonadota bacterium]